MIVALGWLVIPATDLTSQELRGVVVAAQTGEPVSGAFVELLRDLAEPAPDSPGRLDAVISGASGSFSLSVPNPGLYYVRVQRIGFETWTSGPIEVPRDGAAVRLAVPIAPIALPGLVATGSRRCDGDREELLRAYELYEDAVRAIEPVVWTESAGLHAFEVELGQQGPSAFPSGTPIEPEHYEDYRRWRDEGERISTPAGDREAYLRLMEATYPRPPDTVRVRRPIATLSSEDLAESGYVRVVDGDLRYFAPTAATLASSHFREGHCFEVTKNEEGWVGLRFQPVPGAVVPGVQGVLWLSADRTDPKRLEFEFTELRDIINEHEVPRIRSALRERLDAQIQGGYRLSFRSTRMAGEYGGRLEFERLGDGTGITRRWELRFPILWYFMTNERGGTRFRAEPVALQMTRRGLVTAVLAPGSVVDTAAGR